MSSKLRKNGEKGLNVQNKTHATKSTHHTITSPTPATCINQLG